MLFISLLCLLGATKALAWGQKGHDVVAYIAECNLTPEAAEKIDKILGGASMVYGPTGSTRRATRRSMPHHLQRSRLR